ncbi:MAG TPA: aminotransferase class V-fold PLP-dependent enzyme [Polyangium sp.]|nr:aminotransferase class V-fold PLP-dependent enzyme [Polyangium sp.]
MTESRASTMFDIRTFREGYGRFVTDDRILLTGHSHQAWPDVARHAMVEAFDDAARFVDDKWGNAVFPKMATVGGRILERLGFPQTDAITFGKSTHELVTRLLSCFPLSSKTTIVTTTGEFHSLYRQLSRLSEEGVRVVWVDGSDRQTLADRLIEAIVPGVSLVAFSGVFFGDAFVLPRIGEIAQRAMDVGAIPLVDAYHAFNVVPLEWGPVRDKLFVTAGGYKYAQMGEGICFLRVPADTTLRPMDTGWFADFPALERERDGKIEYGPRGERFSGATFDPTPFYRADAVLRHFDSFGLTVEQLREISLRQTKRILDVLDDAGLGGQVVSPRLDERRGGFVAIRCAQAPNVVARLRARGVFSDARNDVLRLGPAPYLYDEEIDRGTRIAAEEMQREKAAE